MLKKVNILGPIKRKWLVSTVRLIGDRLETLALRGGHETDWIGLDHTRGMAGRSNHRALNSATASQASRCSWPTSAPSPGGRR